MAANLHFDVSKKDLEAFCRKWRIVELALFGSVLREDFRDDSDIDVLATFSEDVDWSVFDFARMNQELSKLVGRKVDLFEKAGLRNPFRRRHILATHRVIYAC